MAAQSFLSAHRVAGALLVLAFLLLPAWAGWGTVVFSLAMLVVLLIVGDTLPAFHYVPFLLMGFSSSCVGKVDRCASTPHDRRRDGATPARTTSTSVAYAPIVLAWRIQAK